MLTEDQARAIAEGVRIAASRGSVSATAAATVESRGAALDTLSTHAATLEDLFVALTGRQLRDE